MKVTPEIKGPSARSQLMRAVCECPTLPELRAAVVEVACELPDTGRDTVRCGPPDYPGDLAESAPPTPITMRSPRMPDFGERDFGGVL
jgi:hypothetical protein